MIAKLKGIIDTLHEDSLILDVNGVGYLLSCSLKTLSMVGQAGQSVTLHVDPLLRPDQIQLFGFTSLEEKTWFRYLLTVQGVGGKAALALLSVFTPLQLVQAILAQDKSLLTRAEGVGAKLASRLITELKEKASQWGYVPSVEPTTSSTFCSEKSGEDKGLPPPYLEDAASALINLGYQRSEAYTAVAQAAQNLSAQSGLPDLIRYALNQLRRAG